MTRDIRQWMTENPYAPNNQVGPEQQKVNATNYIAFYLGEIEKHLRVIAESVKANGSTNEQIRQNLEEMQKKMKSGLTG